MTVYMNEDGATIEKIVTTMKKNNRKNDTKLIIKAYEFAKNKHEDQLRKSGEPYIIHPLEVANILADLELDDATICAALLHDVLEDTNVTEDELRNMFPNEIVDGVITLTHRKDESYFEYISRVSTSKLAKKVKVADLLHNLDITRIKEPTKQDYQRLEKYKKAILYLATH